MSDASAEQQDFQNSYFARPAFLRVADEANNKNSLDQFQGLGNYLIQNEKPAFVLFSIDRAAEQLGTRSGGRRAARVPRTSRAFNAQ
jgi:hypothetical protein